MFMWKTFIVALTIAEDCVDGEKVGEVPDCETLASILANSTAVEAIVEATNGCNVSAEVVGDLNRLAIIDEG